MLLPKPNQLDFVRSSLHIPLSVFHQELSIDLAKEMQKDQILNRLRNHLLVTVEHLLRDVFRVKSPQLLVKLSRKIQLLDIVLCKTLIKSRN